MHFTRIEQNWLHSVFSGIYPRPAREGALHLGAGDLDTSAGLGLMERGWPEGTLWTLRLALWVCVFAPLWVLRRARLFPALAPGEQTRVLEKLYQSNVYVLRSLIVLLKAAGGMLLTDDARVRNALAPGLPVAEPHGLVQLRRQRGATATG